mmetsp:Transcript_34337/g.107315  ORF Transcript_34337/g.107315 Transcript_34337/m.107315 type:complete len:212 (-) Transcript_34337:726-1361(-)
MRTASAPNPPSRTHSNRSACLAKNFFTPPACSTSPLTISLIGGFHSFNSCSSLEASSVPPCHLMTSSNASRYTACLLSVTNRSASLPGLPSDIHCRVSGCLAANFFRPPELSTSILKWSYDIGFHARNSMKILEASRVPPCHLISSFKTSRNSSSLVDLTKRIASFPGPQCGTHWKRSWYCKTNFLMPPAFSTSLLKAFTSHGFFHAPKSW